MGADPLVAWGAGEIGDDQAAAAEDVDFLGGGWAEKRDDGAAEGNSDVHPE